MTALTARHGDDAHQVVLDPRAPCLRKRLDHGAIRQAVAAHAGHTMTPWLAVVFQGRRRPTATRPRLGWAAGGGGIGSADASRGRPGEQGIADGDTPDLGTLGENESTHAQAPSHLA